MLNKSNATIPPEKLLQGVWQHQRLRRDQLRRLDGRTMRVIHPSFKNREAGPDFRGAVIQIDGEAPRTGNVEIDLRAAGRHAHRHDHNPNFTNVILHAVWESDRAASAIPTLALGDALDAPLSELDLWFGGESVESLPENFRGPLLRATPQTAAGARHRIVASKRTGAAAKQSRLG